MRRPPFLSGFVAPSCGLMGRFSSAFVRSGSASLSVLAHDSPMSHGASTALRKYFSRMSALKRGVHDAVEKDNAVPLSTLSSLAERGMCVNVVGLQRPHAVCFLSACSLSASFWYRAM